MRAELVTPALKVTEEELLKLPWGKFFILQMGYIHKILTATQHCNTLLQR